MSLIKNKILSVAHFWERFVCGLKGSNISGLAQIAWALFQVFKQGSQFGGIFQLVTPRLGSKKQSIRVFIFIYFFAAAAAAFDGRGEQGRHSMAEFA